MLSKMSDFGKPQPCRNQCGAYIYFDKDSEVGHPSADKWLPLEYNHDSGIKTGLVHQCSKRPSALKLQQSSNLPTGSTQTTKQQEQVSSSSLYQVSDESVNRGISAFSMTTDLIRLVEQSQRLLVSMDGKLDRLLNLTFAQEQKK